MGKIVDWLFSVFTPYFLAVVAVGFILLIIGKGKI